jgi:hypothetical protein
MNTMTPVTRWCTLSTIREGLVSNAPQLLNGIVTSITQKLHDAMESIPHSHEVDIFSVGRLNVVLP